MATNPITNNQQASSYMTDEMGPKKSLGQEDFLRLMVAQVKNQDPMQPQANGEFLAQLAQFGTNEGITNVQKSIQQLNSSMNSNQAVQASSLVGRSVMINTDKAFLGASGDLKVEVKMVEGVKSPTATIFSKTGELIKTIPLGDLKAGNSMFTWDGTGTAGQRVAEGEYRVEVHGQFEGNDVALYTMASAKVDSVSFGANGTGLSLNVAGYGSVPFDQVRQVTL